MRTPFLAGALALFAGLSIVVPAPAAAQFGERMKKTAERAAESEARRQVNRAVRTAIRCAVGDLDCFESAEEDGDEVVFVDENGKVIVDENGDPITDPDEAREAAARSDPGDAPSAGEGPSVLFREDFADDPVGALPSSLDRIGGEWRIAELDGRRVLAYTGNRNGALRIDLPRPLPESFTVEFEAYLPNVQDRLVLLTVEPESANFYGTPAYQHHYLWLDGERSGILLWERRREGVTAKALNEGLVPVRMEVDGSRADLYVGEERIARVADADLPRSDVLWIQSANNTREPLFLTDLRVVAD